MAKRVTVHRPKAEKPGWKTEICDTCRFSEWITDDHRHINLKGEAICLRCPHYPHYIVRGRRACSKWESKFKNNIT